MTKALPHIHTGLFAHNFKSEYFFRRCSGDAVTHVQRQMLSLEAITVRLPILFEWPIYNEWAMEYILPEISMGGTKEGAYIGRIPFGMDIGLDNPVCSPAWFG